jgi:hypothetical protein
MVIRKTTRFNNMKPTLFAAAFVALAAVSLPAYSEGDAARLAINSARELYASGNWETSQEAYEDAISKAGKGSVAEAEATIELASLLWEQGDYVAADAKAKTALRQAKKLKLDAAVGRLMLTLGHIEASRGKFAAAENTLKICVKGSKEQRDANFEALCRINLRFVRQLRGKAVGSNSAYKRDLNTLKKSGQSALVGTALAKSAELQEKAQDFAGALKTLRQAEAQFLASGSVPAQARHKLRVAQALQNLNRWPEAAKELDGLVLQFRNMKSRPSLVTAYALRGKQRAHDQDTKGARSDLQKARSTAKSLGSPHLLANADLALCEHWAVAKQTDKARKHCMSASEGFKRSGIPALAARSRILLARLAQSKEEWLTARTEYVEALRILSEEVAKSARDAREIAVQQVNLCQVEIKLKANGAHRRCLDASKALKGIKASDASLREMIAATNYSLGASTPANKPSDAIAAYEAASRDWLALGNGGQAAEAMLRLGKLQADRKRTRVDAIATFERGLKALGAPTDAARLELAVQLAIQKGQAELATQAWDAASTTLEGLITWAKKASDDYSTAWAYSGLAQALLKRGKRDAALKALETGRSYAKRAKDEELLTLFENNLKKLGKQ